MIEILIRPAKNEVEGDAFQRLDLFSDENIELELSLKKSRDLKNVSSDFSRRFTIPATSNNNRILRHFYRDDIADSLGYTERIPCAIAINGDVFRTGDIKLLNAKIKDGDPYSYSIQFFGKATRINNIGDIKLGAVDFSAYNHPFNGETISDGMTSGLFSEDIIYPLSSPVKRWYYDGTESPANDYNIAPIDEESNGLNYYEVKPAIRFKSILEKIGESLDISFSGDFYNDSDSPLNTTYMWLHSSEGNLQDALSVEGGFPPVRATFSSASFTLSNARFTFNSNSNSFKLTTFRRSGGSALFTFNFSGVTYSGDFELWAVVNGTRVRVQTFSSPDNSGGFVLKLAKNDEVYFEVQSSISQTIDLGTLEVFYFTGSVGTATASSISYGNDVVISSLMPDMSIIEFVNGVIKMFNLVIQYDESQSFETYKLSEFDSVFENAEVTSLTEFVNSADISVEQPVRYNLFGLKYSDSEQFSSKIFKGQFGREYGEFIANISSAEKGEYKIEVPFEIPYMETLEDVSNSEYFPVFFCQSDVNFDTSTGDSESYYGAPVIFSISGETISYTNGINFIDDTGTQSQLTTLYYFGLFYNYDFFALGATRDSLGFSTDASKHPLTNQYESPISSRGSNEFSQYNNYWEDTFERSASARVRMLTLSGYADLSKVRKINLLDVVEYAGQLYTIDQAKINITNGKFEVKLLTRI